MPNPERGEFSSPLDIDTDRSIDGSVTGDVVVRQGRNLVVRGHVGGNLTVERDAMVTIYGTAHGQVVANEGLIVVAGHTTWDPPSVPGNFAACLGTVFGDGNVQRILLSGGALEPIRDATVNIDAEKIDSYFYFDHSTGTFHPTSELG